jgi:hypothetical protein
MSILPPSRAAAAAILALLPLVSAGCQTASSRAPQAAADPAGHVPEDLSIDLAVRIGFGVGERARIEERNVRLVLLADGTLCAATERVPRDDTRPPRVRRLAREQMTELWSTLVASGFAEVSSAEARGNVALLEPAAGEVLATLELHANGERLTYARRYRPEDEREQAMRGVVRAVASLAWASDEALVESAELPTRYDLGADPYARFAPRPVEIAK